jgi:hypothetical protein
MEGKYPTVGTTDSVLQYDNYGCRSFEVERNKGPECSLRRPIQLRVHYVVVSHSGRPSRHRNADLVVRLKQLGRQI